MMSNSIQRRARERSARADTGQVFGAMGSLLAFAGPARTLHPANAAEIDRSAWARAGAAIRGAMLVIRRNASGRH